MKFPHTKKSKQLCNLSNPHCLHGGILGKLGIAKPIVEPRAKGGAATAAPVGQESIQNWQPSLWYVCCSSFIFMFMFK